jgi:hypothetical protein
MCHLNHKFIFIVKLRGGGTCGNEGTQFIFIAGSTSVRKTIDQWALDDNIRSAEDRLVEEHFTTNHEHDADGRFIVKLPFNASPANIGTTRDIAMKRYFTLERKIHGNSVFAARYKEFMKEYEVLNHMVPVTELQAELGSMY